MDEVGGDVDGRSHVVILGIEQGPSDDEPDGLGALERRLPRGIRHVLSLIHI